MNKWILTVFTFMFMINTLVFGQDKIISRIESLQSLYIELYKDSIPIGSATGFIIKPKFKYYLITNWHVVTNKNPVTKSWIDPNNKVAPNKIAIMHNGKGLGTYSLRFENLVDSNSKILYKEYSIDKEMLDVVALPLKDTSGNITIYPVNYLPNTDSIIIQPTDRLFVLGFPKGVRSAPFMPIWKSGLIASEPDIDQENKPIIWLDIESFGGMSGSPVYLITDKLQYKNGSTANLMGGQLSFFMGVFSHGQDINVGALWKNNYLKNIFKALP
jgi:hypothetical protein